MKRKRIPRLALALLAGVALLAVGAPAQATQIPDGVGVIGGEIAPGYEGKEAQLREGFRQAYVWGSRLAAFDGDAEVQKPDTYFDFGKLDGDLVHRWERTMLCQENDCMIQFFYEGSSYCQNAMGRDNTVALICPDPTTMEVFILRDAPAEAFFKGGINANYGYPTTNQYWRMEDGVPVLYQQFSVGYFQADWGDTWFLSFHHIIDEGTRYVEPPAAPDPDAPPDQPNADGCTWEHPQVIAAWRRQETSRPADSAQTAPSAGEGGIIDPSDPALFNTLPAQTADPAPGAISPYPLPIDPPAETTEVAGAAETGQTEYSTGPSTSQDDEPDGAQTSQSPPSGSAWPAILLLGGMVLLLAVGGVALLLVRRKGPPDQPCA